jgi:hypothetical protein
VTLPCCLPLLQSWCLLWCQQWNYSVACRCPIYGYDTNRYIGATVLPTCSCAVGTTVLTMLPAATTILIPTYIALPTVVLPCCLVPLSPSWCLPWRQMWYHCVACSHDNHDTYVYRVANRGAVTSIMVTTVAPIMVPTGTMWPTVVLSCCLTLRRSWVHVILRLNMNTKKLSKDDFILSEYCNPPKTTN